MIYRTLCTFLRWYMRLVYPKARVVDADTLPADRPYILVCHTKNIFKGALLLAAHMPSSSLRFVRKYDHALSPLKKFVLQALHIIPLLPLDKKINRSQQTGHTWKDLRELITDNHPLVFFTDQKHNARKASKGAAKLAFHTESVFDFHLNIKLIPVNIIITEPKTPVIHFSEGIAVAHYEKEYKQYPARTIREISSCLDNLLALHESCQIREEQPQKQLVS